MADFGYMGDLRVTTDRTVEFVLDGITLPNGKSPTLVGRIAGEANKPYFNAVLKHSIKRAKAIKAGRVSAEMLGENRAHDLKLFPSHVIVGWKDVCDGAGEEVPFSEADCAKFLGMLPDHVFDEVRNFFADGDNFVGEMQTVTREDASRKGKSSASE